VFEDRQPHHLKANAEHSSGAALAAADGPIRPNRPRRTAPPESANRSRAPASPADASDRRSDQPRHEQIVLAAIAPLPWPHRITLHRADGGRESRLKPPFNSQEIKLRGGPFLQMQILAQPRKPPRNKSVQDTSQTTNDGRVSSFRRMVPLMRQ
jgi:hypothetical protein